jgi:hypothetical protein
MKHEIIYTDDYALIVSDEYILNNTYILHDYLHYNKIHFCVSCSEDEIHIKGDLPSLFREECKKVIAHRPLADVLILEGVPLLPEFGEGEDVGKIAEQEFYLDFDAPLFEALGITKKVQKSILIGMLQGTFNRGYNKAKETYKYTEEDLINFSNFVTTNLMEHSDSNGFYIGVRKVLELFKQIQKPKRPKYFTIKTTNMNLDEIREQGKGFLHANTDKPVIITNSQGQRELVGTYEGGEQ